MPDLIEIPASDSPESAAARFTQQFDVIMFLFGGSDDAIAPQVRSLFARALIPAAIFSRAVIVDDGSATGLSGVLGQAAEQADQAPTLLGISDPGVTSVDPYHGTVMRLPSDWSDPAKARFLITASLAVNASAGSKPAAALLIGGTNADRITALRCARRCWPLFIAKGAGGLGDTILSAQAAVDAGGSLAQIDDPEIREIVESGSIRSLDLAGDTDSLKQVFLAPLRKPGEILEDVWHRFDDLDLEAIDKQTLFRWTQYSILLLTVLATLVAIVVTIVVALTKTQPQYQHLGSVLHIVMIIIPIGISLLVAFNARFREGNKWILLRAAAESVKQHIFRYRTQSGIYSPSQCSSISASTKLALNIRDITSNLVQSEVNRTSIPSRKVQDESRTRFLTAEQYLHDRVDNQINYFVGKTASLYRQLKRLQFWILIAGGIGTFLAAINLDVWVALTTAIATALTSKLELDQVENSLVQYNTALTSLRNIESWWKGLSPWERMRPKNLDLLVDQTETTLEHETAGWVQKMQSTLDKLTEKEADKKDSDQKQG